MTYAEIWNKDIQSGSCTNNPSFDFYSQMQQMRSQLGDAEFEKQIKEVSDWHREMRQRVQEKFATILGEIMTNPQIPTTVQEKAREIHEQLT